MPSSLSIYAESKENALTKITDALERKLGAGDFTKEEHDSLLSIVKTLIDDASEPDQGFELIVSGAVSTNGRISISDFKGFGIQGSVAIMPLGAIPHID